MNRRSLIKLASYASADIDDTLPRPERAQGSIGYRLKKHFNDIGDGLGSMARGTVRGVMDQYEKERGIQPKPSPVSSSGPVLKEKYTPRRLKIRDSKLGPTTERIEYLDPPTPTAQDSFYTPDTTKPKPNPPQLPEFIQGAGKAVGGAKGIYRTLVDPVSKFGKDVIHDLKTVGSKLELAKATNGYNVDVDPNNKSTRYLVSTHINPNQNKELPDNEFRFTSTNVDDYRKRGEFTFDLSGKDNAFDYYSNLGYINPLQLSDAHKKSLVSSGIDLNRPDRSKTRSGIIDLDSVTAHQLGDTPVAKAIAKRLSEVTYQNRYNLLKGEDKKIVDNITKQTGQHPHYSTITLPEPMYRGWKNTGALKDGDVLYANSNMPNAMTNGGALVYTEDRQTPMLYDTKAGLPDINMPTEFSLSRTNALDADGRLNQEALNNPMLKGYLNGRVPIVDNQLADQANIGQVGLGSFSTPRLLPLMQENNSADVNELARTSNAASIPGISLVSSIVPVDNGIMAAFSDLARGTMSDMRRAKPKLALKSNSKGTADHEHMHTLNHGSARAAIDAMEKLHSLENGLKALKKNNKVDFIPSNMRNIIGKSVGSYVKNLNDKASKALDDSGRNGAGFIDPFSYTSVGGQEHTRALATAKRLVLNHLANVLPAQMEAKGLFNGLSDQDRLDMIADKAVSMANNPLVFRHIMSRFGSGDGHRTPLHVPENVMGTLDPFEVTRALEGLDKTMRGSSDFTEYMNPEDAEKYYNDGQRDYRPVSDKYLEQILPLIGRSDSRSYSNMV